MKKSIFKFTKISIFIFWISIQIAAAQCPSATGNIPNHWFSTNSSGTNPIPAGVAVSADGKKVAIGTSSGSYGYLDTARAYQTIVLNTSDWSVDKTLSQANSYPMGGDVRWTKSGGYYYRNAAGKIDYISPTGTYSSSIITDLAGQNFTADDYNNMDTIIYSSTSFTVKMYNIKTSTSSIVYTPSGIYSTYRPGVVAYNPSVNPNIIYFALVQPTTYKAVVKAWDIKNNIAPAGWTDYELGYVLNHADGDTWGTSHLTPEGPNFGAFEYPNMIDIEIRPTDGKIFVLRENYDISGNTQQNSWQVPTVSEVGCGLFVLTTAGRIDSSYNHAWGTPAGGSTAAVIGKILSSDEYPELHFDAMGNLFTNAFGGSIGYPIGIMKFFPSGKPDFNFMENWMNYYRGGRPQPVANFDILPNHNLIYTASQTYNASKWTGSIIEGHTAVGDSWGLDGFNIQSYDIYNSITLDPRGFYNEPYQFVHLSYNSGNLILPGGGSTAYQTANCDNTNGTGNLICDSIKLRPAPTVFVASNGTLIIGINATSTGILGAATVSGSGYSNQYPVTLSASTTGYQNYSIPVKYDGVTPFGIITVSIGSLGSCTLNLGSTTPSVIQSTVIVPTSVCTPNQVGPALK